MKLPSRRKHVQDSSILFSIGRAVPVLLILLAIGFFALTETLHHPQSSDATSNGNEAWLEIWTRKGGGARSMVDEPLHHVTGFTEITTSQYQLIVKTILTSNKNIGFDQFQSNSSIVEFGCGAGGFLETLRTLKPEKELGVNGIDYSPAMVEVARKRVHGGTFWHSDVRDVQAVLPDKGTFDVAVSFSVLYYLDALQDVYQALSEMARVTKKGGTIIIADINDAKKRAIADKIRGESTHYQAVSYKSVAKVTPPHLYIPQNFFWDSAAKLGIKIDSIVNEDELVPDLSFYCPSQWRYTVFATKL